MLIAARWCRKCFFFKLIPCFIIFNGMAKIPVDTDIAPYIHPYCQSSLMRCNPPFSWIEAWLESIQSMIGIGPESKPIFVRTPAWSLDLDWLSIQVRIGLQSKFRLRPMEQTHGFPYTGPLAGNQLDQASQALMGLIQLIHVLDAPHVRLRGHYEDCKR